MKVRLLAAGAVVASLGVALVPAQATPYAGQFRYFNAGTMTVQGADGARWLLAVGATQGTVESRPEQRLYVDLSRCAANTCVSKGKWSRPLTSTEIAISADFTQSQLHTVVAGQTLDVSMAYTGLPGPGIMPAGAIYGPVPVGGQPGINQFYDASGTLHLSALRCAAEGALGQVTGVDTEGDDVRDPRKSPPSKLPAGFLTGGKHKASCSA